jgi:hypothetical protein
MGIKKTCQILLFGLLLPLIGLFFPNNNTIESATAVTLSVSPLKSSLPVGGDFWVNINVSAVTDLNFYQFNVEYDPAVIQMASVEGGEAVTGGRITDGTTGTVKNISVIWNYVTGAGKVRIIGNLNAVLNNGAKGTGYLARMHFIVTGIAGEQSDITPRNVVMRNTVPASIPQNAPVWGTISVSYPPVIVNIDAPTNLAVGGRFTARVNISLISNFKAFQFVLSYNPAVIRIIGDEGGFEGVKPGLIESTVIPIDMWGYLGSPGTVGVLGNIPADLSATGEGYITEIEFQIIGSLGASTQLNFIDIPFFEKHLINELDDKFESVTWINSQLNVNSLCSIVTNSRLPRGEVGLNYTQPLSAWGGTAPYTWSIQSGTLPQNVILDPNTGIISGIPTAAFGPAAVTIQINDAAGHSAIKAMILTILSPPAISTTSLHIGEIGITYSQSMLAAGGATPYTWIVQSGTLPPGLTLTSTGVINGTPVLPGGEYNLVLAVIDALGGMASSAFTLTVIAEPVITSKSPLPVGEVGIYYSQALTYLGGTLPFTWSVSAGALPRGLILDSGSGVISGTPTSTSVGSTTVTFRFVDAHNRIATKTLSMTIVAKPKITTTVIPDKEVGTNYNFTLGLSGGAYPVTWSIQTGVLPEGLALNSGTGNISGVPTKAKGPVSLTFRVFDSLGGVAVTTLAMTILPGPQITTTVLANGEVGASYSKTLAAQKGKTPYQWLVLSGNLPQGLVLNSKTGAISGKPAVEVGPIWVKFQVVDSAGGSATKDISMTIQGAPQITSNALAEGIAGVTYKQTLGAVKGVPPYKFKIHSGALPSGLTLNVGGSISGKPTKAAGPYVVTFKVTDSLGGNSTKGLSMMIYPGLSITNSALASGEAGVAYSQTLVASGGGTIYTWSTTKGTLPAGLLLDKYTGKITGKPLKTTKSTSITFQVTDNLGGKAARALSIAIVPGPSITTTALSDAEVGFAYNQPLTVIDGTVPYLWSIESGALPDGLTIDKNTGIISGNPVAAAGPLSVTIKVTDSSGSTAMKKFTMSVVNGPSITTTSLANAQVGKSYSQPLAVTGGVSPYVWAKKSGNLPTGIKFTAATGVLSGTPATAGGPYLITFMVTDKLGVSITKQLSLSVAPKLAITTTVLAKGEPGVYYSQLLAAIGGTTPYTWSKISGNLPKGLSLNPATGEIYGTPTAVGGPTNAVFKVTDKAGGTNTKSLSITIVALPSITTAYLNQGKAGNSYTQNLAATNGVAPYTWSIEAGTLPKGLTLNSAKGTITGKPTEKTSGISLTIKVTDSAGGSATRNFTLKIN